MLADGRFIFPDDIIGDSVNSLLAVNSQMIQHYNKMPKAEFFANTKLNNIKEFPKLLRKVWAKDLLAEYMLYLLETKGRDLKPRVLH